MAEPAKWDSGVDKSVRGTETRAKLIDDLFNTASVVIWTVYHLQSMPGKKHVAKSLQKCAGATNAKKMCDLDEPSLMNQTKKVMRVKGLDITPIKDIWDVMLEVLPAQGWPMDINAEQYGAVGRASRLLNGPSSQLYESDSSTVLENLQRIAPEVMDSTYKSIVTEEEYAAHVAPLPEEGPAPMVPENLTPPLLEEGPAPMVPENLTPPLPEEGPAPQIGIMGMFQSVVTGLMNYVSTAAPEELAPVIEEHKEDIAQAKEVVEEAVKTEEVAKDDAKDAAAEAEKAKAETEKAEQLVREEQAKLAEREKAEEAAREERIRLENEAKEQAAVEAEIQKKAMDAFAAEEERVAREKADAKKKADEEIAEAERLRLEAEAAAKKKADEEVAAAEADAKKKKDEEIAAAKKAEEESAAAAKKKADEQIAAAEAEIQQKAKEAFAAEEERVAREKVDAEKIAEASRKEQEALAERLRAEVAVKEAEEQAALDSKKAETKAREEAEAAQVAARAEAERIVAEQKVEEAKVVVETDKIVADTVQKIADGARTDTVVENAASKIEISSEKVKKGRSKALQKVEELNERIRTLEEQVVKISSRSGKKRPRSPVAPLAEPFSPTASPVAPLAEPFTPIASPVAPLAEPFSPTVSPVAPLAEPFSPGNPPTPSVGTPGRPYNGPVTDDLHPFFPMDISDVAERSPVSTPPTPTEFPVDTHVTTVVADIGKTDAPFLANEPKVPAEEAGRHIPRNTTKAEMLGTACVYGSKEGQPEGCFSDKSHNVKCESAGDAARGLCRLASVAVPTEHPLGLKDSRFKVYRGLDRGTQIKLQLHRAKLHYRNAARLFTTCNPRVYDRHFNVIKNPKYRGDAANVPAHISLDSETVKILANPVDYMAQWDNAMLRADTSNYWIAFVAPEYGAPIHGPDPKGHFLQVHADGKARPKPMYKDEEGKKLPRCINKAEHLLALAIQHLYNALVLYVYCNYKPALCNGTIPLGAFAFMTPIEVDVFGTMMVMIARHDPRFFFRQPNTKWEHHTYIEFLRVLVAYKENTADQYKKVVEDVDASVNYITRRHAEFTAVIGTQLRAEGIARSVHKDDGSAFEKATK